MKINSSNFIMNNYLYKQIKHNCTNDNTEKPSLHFNLKINHNMLLLNKNSRH